MDHNRFVELWSSGITRKEIAKQLNLSISQVDTYARKHRDECPVRWQKKSEKIETIESITEDDEVVQKNFVAEKDLTIVLDTSSVRYAKTFEIIEYAKRVIIPSVVLIELNNLKDAIKTEDASLYQAIQKLLKACALDLKSEKYSILNFVRSINECTDQTIVRNAANIKNVVVVTSDYGMCCFCKLYNVGYALVVDNVVTTLYNLTSDQNQPYNLTSDQNQPFSLIREDERLILKCLRGTIKVQNSTKLERLIPTEKITLSEGDKVTVNLKKETLYICKRNKSNLLVLRPKK